jgi:hypothetical protein
VERFETSPILAVTSAEMRSGKTRTLDCPEVLIPNPFRIVIPSEAAQGDDNRAAVQSRC